VAALVEALAYTEGRPRWLRPACCLSSVNIPNSTGKSPTTMGVFCFPTKRGCEMPTKKNINTPNLPSPPRPFGCQGPADPVPIHCVSELSAYSRPRSRFEQLPYRHLHATAR